MQIEHAEAIANIDEILAVDGIDVFFIGPSDLSQSMGYPGDPKAAPVAAVIEKTLAMIHAAGKTPGMPATTETLGTVIGSGCRDVYNHLPRILDAGAKEFLGKAGRCGDNGLAVSQGRKAQSHYCAASDSPRTRGAF